MMSKAFFVFVAFLLLSAVASSQDLNRYTFSYRVMPATARNDESFFSGTSATYNHLFASSSEFKTMVGVNGEWIHCSAPSDSLHLSNLYSVSVPLTGIIPVKTGQRLLVTLAPQLTSDFNDFSFQSFRFSTTVVYSWTTENKNTWSLGLHFSKQFFGYQLVPFYSATIHLSDKFTLSGMLPLNPKLTYKLSDDNKIGISFAGNSHSFRLSGASEGRYVDLRQTGLNVFFQHAFSRKLKLETSMGLVQQRMRVYDNSETIPFRLFLSDLGKTRQPVEELRLKGISLQVKLSYSFMEGFSMF